MLSLLLVVATARGQTPIAWPNDLPEGARFAEPTETMPHRHVVLSNTGAEPQAITIATVEQPGLSTLHYAVRGQVRYKGVNPPGYLQMWSHFGRDRAFFTRTLAESGPMSKLAGDSDWRSFALPFQSHADAGMPDRLVIQVVIPAKGTVAVGPLTLGAAMTDEGAWWDGTTGGWIGGLGGAALGLIGLALGLLMSRPGNDGVVVALAVAMLVAGIGLLTLGVVAAAAGQPYAVYYPPLLLGALATGLGGFTLVRRSRQTRAQEWRRMQAMDA
jgi:hypothetical protein